MLQWLKSKLFERSKPKANPLEVLDVYTTSYDPIHCPYDRGFTVYTADKNKSLFGYLDALWQGILRVFGGYSGEIELPRLKVSFGMYEDKTKLIATPQRHAMRTFCQLAINEHGGLCKIKEDIINVTTPDGYKKLGTRFFEMAHEVQTDYAVDEYEEAIPIEHRSSVRQLLA